MSYGFEVWTHSGSVRVFDGSWLFKYHSTHTVTAPADSTATKSIPGFDPNTWGIQVVTVVGDEDKEWSWVLRVRFYYEQVKVYAPNNSSITVKFHVFKA